MRKTSSRSMRTSPKTTSWSCPRARKNRSDIGWKRYSISATPKWLRSTRNGFPCGSAYCGKTAEAFAALLEQYRGDSGVRPGHWSNRFSERDILLTFTFIHRFSAAIVKETLSRENVPPES